VWILAASIRELRERYAKFANTNTMISAMRIDERVRDIGFSGVI